MQTTESRKKVLGVNDDQDFCCCCGKEGLRRVVWIEDIETGEVAHFGTTCAAKNAPALFGEIKESIRAHDKHLSQQAKEELSRLRQERTDKFLARKDELYRQRGGGWVTKLVGAAKIEATIPTDSDLMQECWEQANQEIPMVQGRP